ncbi:hypothetical protein [Pseudomonas sp. TWRC1-2]|uniref:hypothetical protein n=1 Tax=Pseudomonas sp. TWRC1-2 TaxID=2804628 RepID=UPI003CEC5954
MDELLKFLAPYHFPILGFDANSSKEMLVGTCIILSIGERYFIVTASHVMNERQNVKNKELWLWNYHDGSKYTITEDIIGNDQRDVPHWHDVAVVEIDVRDYKTLDYHEFYEKCFLGLERVVVDLKACDPGADVAYLISGFPCSKNKNLKKVPHLLAFFTKEVGKESGSAIDNLATISLEWNSKQLVEQGMALPAPQGMSGGGVWALTKDHEFNPRLFAISVAHIKRENKIIAVKMAVVLAILQAFFPGTKLEGVDMPLSVLVGEQ